MTTAVNHEALIAAVRNRLAAAQRARVRAEHERDAAQAQAEQARQQLAAEFGVSTVEEARTQLVQLEADRDAALAALTAALDEMGA